MGIVFGDGGINNLWQLVISLNSEADAEYSKYVQSLIKGLFNLDIATRKRPNKNVLTLVCSSTNLVDFLIENGAVRGNKIEQCIDIPNWIYNNFKFERAFVRGLVDTDGCLYIHNHNVKGKFYKNIGFCFTSYSRKLAVSIGNILKKNGITPHITDDDRRIYLYSSKAVSDYLSIFGSSNPRILDKYAEWRGARVADRARLESG